MIASAYGERAIFVDLEIEEAPDRATRTHAAARELASRFPAADVVVGAGSVMVHGVEPEAALPLVADLDRAASSPSASSARIHTLRVVYDGPDLDEVAARAALTPAEVIARHAEREYLVELAGFLPGFAYLGPLDPRLVVPRRASPRPRVEAGSVGIAGAFTGVYPIASPGGWNLLGRAIGVSLFALGREPPGLFAPGDVVRIERADAADAGVEPRDSAPPHAPERRGGFVVELAGPGVTVQDTGRAGQLARGLPPSGPLDRVAYEAAVRAAGNAPNAAAIEIPLGRLVIVMQEAAVVSVDGEPAQRLAPGDRFEVQAAARAVRYLAVAGGVDVPLVLGSRATLLSATLGGFSGRSLRRGDVLAIGRDAQALGRDAQAIDGEAQASSRDAQASSREAQAFSRDAQALGRRARAIGRDEWATSAAPPLDDVPSPAVLDIDPGPHATRLGAVARDALLAGAWRVSRLGNRVGVRLEGARIPRDGGDLGAPVPMIRGAVQITTDGTPIVLGPDHPTTGGYPVLAVVREASCALLARVRPGGEVRFRFSA